MDLRFFKPAPSLQPVEDRQPKSKDSFFSRKHLGDYRIISWLYSIFHFRPIAIPIGIGTAIASLPFFVVAGYIEKSMLYSVQLPALEKMSDEVRRSNGLMYTLIGAPIWEEFIFRGCILPAGQQILEKIGVDYPKAAFVSTLTTSLLFATGHLPGAKLFSFTMSVIFSGLTFSCNNNLWPSIIAHVSHNSLSVASSYSGMK